MDNCYFIDPGCSLESAERKSTQVTCRANCKKRLTVLYIVEHPNQEGDTCIDWTSQYCWTNGWNCLWRGHSVYRNRPLIPPVPGYCFLGGGGGAGSLTMCQSSPRPWAFFSGMDPLTNGRILGSISGYPQLAPPWRSTGEEVAMGWLKKSQFSGDLRRPLGQRWVIIRRQWEHLQTLGCQVAPIRPS